MKLRSDKKINVLRLDSEVSVQHLADFIANSKIEYGQLIHQVIASFAKDSTITYRKLKRIRRQIAYKLLSKVTR